MQGQSRLVKTYKYPWRVLVAMAKSTEKAAKGTDETSAKTDDMSKEEQVGYHKGSLAVLTKEREELSRILGIVEQLMQMHVSALKELGVDLEEQAKQMQSEKKKPPIEDIL